MLHDLRKSLLLLLLPVSAVAFSAGQQTYYVLGFEPQVLDVLSYVACNQAGETDLFGTCPAATPPAATQASSFVGINIPADGQILVYDHGEDGYEPDYAACLAGTCAQASTQVWGDGNLANGAPPGDADDLLVVNQVLNLESSGQANAPGCAATLCNPIPLNPYSTAVLRFDGSDVVHTVGQPINLVHVVFPAQVNGGFNSITMIGGTWENFPVEAYDDNLTYTIPAGEDSYLADTVNFNSFRFTFVVVQASEDDTPVIVDNGTSVVSFVLQRGQSWSSRGLIGTTAGSTPAITIDAGTTVTAGKPIQVGLITAGTQAYDTRFYNVIPTGLYASEYMVPVFSRNNTAGNRSDVIVNNPNGFAIMVTAQDTGGTVSLPVAANSATSFRAIAGRSIANNSALRLTSDNLFWGVGVYGDFGGDWGYALQPSGFLQKAVAVPHGPGNRNQVDAGGAGAGTNGSPIWVASLDDNVTFSVDWDGDGVADGVDTSNNGVSNGTSFTVNALQALTLFDPSDDDQTGAVITADGRFVATWGYADTGGSNNSGQVNNLDWGYAINPYDFRFLEPTLTVTKTAVPNNVVAPGGTVTFTVCSETGILVPVDNQDIVDTLPPDWTYEPGSAILTYPDGSTVQLDPVITGSSGTGLVLTWDISQQLNTKEEVCIEFQASVTFCTSTATPVTETWQAPGTPANPASYAGGAGWTGSWTETGDDGSAVGGQVRVRTSAGGGTCSNSNHLEFRDGRGAAVHRIADLSGFCSPQLSLDQRADFLGGGDSYLIEASTDGVTYAPLATLTAADNSGACATVSYDLSAYKAVTTYLRFRGGACTPAGAAITDDLSAGYGAAGGGWLGPWIDDGDGGGATTDGDIRVIAGASGACPVDSHLRLEDVENEALNQNDSDAVSRAVDLSGFCHPQITMDWRVNLNNTNEGYSFQASADGGATWTNIQTWVLADEVAGCTTTTFDLGAFRSANAMIRFTGDGSNDGGDFLYIDNIVIDEAAAGTGPGRFFLDNLSIVEAAGGLPPYVDNVARGSGEYQGFPFTSRDEARVFYNSPALTLTVDKAQAEVGDVLTYTLSYQNLLPTVINTVTLQAPIPAFTTLVPGSILSAPGLTTVTSSASKSITWGPFNLPASGTGTTSFQVLVGQVPFDQTPIPEVVTGLVGGVRTVDSNEVETLIRTPVFQLLKDAPGAVSSGTDLTFSFQLYNHGGAGATGVKLTDRIPANTSFVVGSDMSLGSTEFSSTPADAFAYLPVAAADGTDAAVARLRFDLGSMAPASLTTAGFTVRVTTGTAANTVIRNVGLLTNDQTTVRTTNITETVVTDLHLDLAASTTVACPRRRIHYDLTVSNAGGGSFTDLVVVQPVPSNSAYELGSALAPSPWVIEYSTDGGASYVLAEPAASMAVTHLRFTLASPDLLAAAASAVFGFDVRVSQFVPAGASVVAQASVDTPSIPVTVFSNLVTLPTVNVRVVKTPDVLVQSQGGVITWNLVVQNIGAAPAQNVVIQEPADGFDVFQKSTLDPYSVSPAATSTSAAAILWSLGTLIPLAPPVVLSFQSVVNSTATSGDVITNLVETTDDSCVLFSDPVQVLIASPGVTLGPDSTSYGDQDDVLYFPLTLTNTGATTDTMELSFSAASAPSGPELTWEANLTLFVDVDGDGSYDPGLDTSVTDTGGALGLDSGPLAPGQTLRLLAQVVIPPAAVVNDGDQNVYSLLATSGVNGANTSSAQLTAIVLTSTAVRLGELAARAGPGGVRVSWATYSEHGNLGFELSRGVSPEGPWLPVGCCLIPGLGTYQGRHAYQALDPEAPASGPLYYRLMDVDALGGRHFHGPVGVDRDGDGLSFDVEARWGLSDDDPDDAGLDPDGDGTSTAEELRTGRDPWVADAPAGTAAAGTPQASTPAPQGIRVVQDGGDWQVLELVLWGYDLTSREVEGRDVVYPVLSGLLAGDTGEPGKPQLPLVGTFLPEGFSQVTLLDSEEEERPGVEVGPAPASREASDGSNLLPAYAFDPDFYGNPPPAYPARVAEVQGGFGVVRPRLVLHAFRYDHGARLLTFRRRIRVRVARPPTRVFAAALGVAADPGLGGVPPGPLFTLRTRAAGVHRLSGAALAGLGIDTTGHDPRNLSMFHGGVEVPIRILGEGDGVFDPSDVLEFYAPEAGDRFAAGDGLQLLLGASAGARWPLVATSAAPPAAPYMTLYRHTARASYRDYYFGALPGSAEEDRFVASFAGWAFAGGGAATAALPVEDPASDGLGGIATVTYGASIERPGSPDHHHQLLFDGAAVGEGYTVGAGFFQAQAWVAESRLTAGTHVLGLKASTEGLPPSRLGEFLVIRDVALEYPRRLRALGDSLEFRAPASGAGAVLEGFTAPDLTLLDVSDPRAPRQISNVAVAGAGPYSLTMTLDPGASRRFLAYAPGGAHGASEVTARPARRAGLRAASLRAGWLAVVPDGWEASLAPLASLRASQGLEPLVVSLQDVADEFTGGVPHPEAVRRLLLWARQRWARSPEYLVLGSDTHMNPRGYAPTFFGLWDTTAPVGVPTHLEFAGPSLYGSEGAHDLWYGLLEGGDAVPEISVGRLPASSAGELAGMAAKIAAYEAGGGTWARQLLVVSDDGEPLFEAVSEGALQPVLPGLQVQRYHRGDGVRFPNYASYKASLDAGLAAGSLLVQFVGHGAQNQWADIGTPTLDVGDAQGMSNGGGLPLVLSFTCNDGYFIGAPKPDGSDVSLAEAMVRNPTGGAIAYYASGVQSTILAKDLLHRAWMQALFAEDQRRIGDAQRRATALYLANSPDREGLIRAFNLLGDPATELAIPNPLRPQNLHILSQTPTQVVIGWDPSADPGVAWYEVYRRTGSDPATMVTTVAGPSFQEGIGAPGAVVVASEIFYSVRAVTADGLGSALAPELEVSTLGATAATPAGLAGGGGGGGGCVGVPGSSDPWALWLVLLLQLGAWRRRARG